MGQGMNGERPMPLTPKQKVTLDYLRAYIAENGYAPTAQEVADHFHIARNAAVCRLGCLHQKSHIDLYARTRRGISLSQDAAPK